MRSIPEACLVGAMPRAPLTLPPGGYHWYIVERVGFPHRQTFMESLEALAGWLEAFAGESGVPWERTVIGGFSQGAVMAYSLALGGGPAVTGGPAGDERVHPRGRGLRARPDRAGLPIAIAHGTLDP